jgi:hypothetical protein
MKLPNPQLAVVDVAKLLDYCLNPRHWRGRHKARLFASALGFTQEDAELLRVELLRAAYDEDAFQGKKDEFGQRYVINFELVGSVGKARVRSSWIVLTGENFPRLVSCYVLPRVRSDGT